MLISTAYAQDAAGVAAAATQFLPLILIFVIINANVLAQTVGFIWIGIGVLILAGLYIVGNRPTLEGLGTRREEPGAVASESANV